jgi:hypothetical protein
MKYQIFIVTFFIYAPTMATMVDRPNSRPLAKAARYQVYVKPRQQQVWTQDHANTEHLLNALSVAPSILFRHEVRDQIKWLVESLTPLVQNNQNLRARHPRTRKTLFKASLLARNNIREKHKDEYCKDVWASILTVLQPL